MFTNIITYEYISKYNHPEIVSRTYLHYNISSKKYFHYNTTNDFIDSIRIPRFHNFNLYPNHSLIHVYDPDFLWFYVKTTIPTVLLSSAFNSYQIFASIIYYFPSQSCEPIRPESVLGFSIYLT